MAKAHLTFATLTSFLTGILIASALSNLYLFFMLFLSGVWLFAWMTGYPRGPILAIACACVIGAAYYSAYVKIYGPLPRQSASSTNQLTGIKNGFVSHLNAELPRREAALAAGLTVGDSTGFDKELKREMAASGTTHLVALSGYNIAIVITFIQALLLGRVGRRSLFGITVVAITLFVIMVGGAASVTRAAIMGGLILLSKEAGRMRNMHGVIALSAFFMALYDPRIVMFNLGFQLSFVSLLGIVYFFPAATNALRTVFRKSDRFGRDLASEDETRRKGWGTSGIREALKEHIGMSTSATLAVLPLTLIYFNTTSLAGVIANVCIASAVPITMFLGFLAGTSAWIMPQLGAIIGWMSYPFLHYELGVIHFFSRFQIPIWKPAAGWVIFPLYYAALAYFTYSWYPRKVFPRKQIS